MSHFTISLKRRRFTKEYKLQWLNFISENGGDRLSQWPKNRGHVTGWKSWELF